jgi:Fe-S cluster biosynthesis and repair protein YggX
MGTPLLECAYRQGRGLHTAPDNSKLNAIKAERRSATDMADVACVTCGQTGAAITAPLFLGKLEAEIKAKVCAECWKKWEGMRVMVINEYQVNLGDESGRDLVRKQMKAFLKLGEQADSSKVAENYRPPTS